MVLAGAAVLHVGGRRDGVIADGVRVAGIGVGGLDSAQANARLERELVPRVDRPIFVRSAGRTWRLSPRGARLHVHVQAAVREALARGGHDSIFTRAVDAITGGGLNVDLPPRISYSGRAVQQFVDDVGRQVDQPAKDATVQPIAAGLEKVPAHAGLSVQRTQLRRALGLALTSWTTDRTIAVPTQTVRPNVKLRDLVTRYPNYIVVDRSRFQLRYYRALSLRNTYTIAVGQQGLETPAGLYEVQDKQVNPSWQVPNSAWAGALAGRLIPPGPDDPLKARWLGFNGSAGIHGTADLGSLGTAASHGCIRMSVPDVEQLYRQAPLHTPVYVR